MFEIIVKIAELLEEKTKAGWVAKRLPVRGLIGFKIQECREMTIGIPVLYNYCC